MFFVSLWRNAYENRYVIHPKCDWAKLELNWGKTLATATKTRNIYLQNLFTYSNTGLTHSVSVFPVIPLLFSTLEHLTENTVKMQMKWNIDMMWV